MHRLKQILLPLLMLVAVILLLPLLIPIMLAAAYGDWQFQRTFRREHAGRVFLVCSRRRGWQACLENNILPALPPSVTAVWLETPGGLQDVIRAARLRPRFVSVPYLLLVSKSEITVRALNERLLHLKRPGRRSVTAQAEAQQIIAGVLGPAESRL